jgi:hypothetical protein
LSRQRCDFWCIAISLEELPHAEQIRASEAAEPRFGPCDIAGQLIDDTITPLSAANFPTDHFTDSPVQIEQRTIHGLVALLARFLDQRGYHRESLGFCS